MYVLPLVGMIIESYFERFTFASCLIAGVCILLFYIASPEKTDARSGVCGC
jgi:hypothetical protein